MKKLVVTGASLALALPLAAQTVHLTVSDSGDQSSLNSDQHWTPSPASDEGAVCDYVVSGGLQVRSPRLTAGTTLTFGGSSLSVGEPDFSSGGVLACRHHKAHVNFPDLRLYKGEGQNGIGGSYQFLEGVATVFSPAADPFVFSLAVDGNGIRQFYYAWRFKGDDAACVKLTGAGTHHFFYKDGGTTTVYENPDYHGSWIFDVSGKINFGNAASLGGAKTTFAADGIVLCGGGTNAFNDSSVTIAAASNRGITLSGRGATLDVPSGKTVQIDVPITSADGARLVKIGAGTLILGGCLDAVIDVRRGSVVKASGFSETARASVIERLKATDVYGECSFDSATHWTPSPASAEGAAIDYCVADGFELRTTQVNATFGGRSLSIGMDDFSSAGSLMCRHSNARVFYADLRLYRGSASNGIGGSHQWLDGTATVFSVASEPFAFVPADTREFIYAWRFVGAETTCVRLGGAGKHHFYYSSGETAAENPDYLGSWIFDGSGELNLSTPLSLGGDKDAFDAEALVISGGGIVCFDAKAAKIAKSSNRGITVRGSGATFKVWTNKSLDIETPLVVEAGATVRKTSGGLLRLSGGVTGGKAAALSVEGGGIAVFGSRAFESYSFASGTTLTVPCVADSSDEQQRFGLIASGGFAVGGAELPLVIEGVGAEGGAKVAVATLPTVEAANALREKVRLQTSFPKRKVELKVLGGELDGQSVATLMVDISVPGLVVIVR